MYIYIYSLSLHLNMHVCVRVHMPSCQIDHGSRATSNSRALSSWRIFGCKVSEDPRVNHVVNSKHSPCSGMRNHSPLCFLVGVAHEVR